MENGRFCNQIIRNMATSLIAEQIDLYVEYCNHDRIARLGIPLFVGNRVYSHKVSLTDDNYMEVFNTAPFVNLHPEHFFQTREISQMIYDRLRSESVRTSVMMSNPFRSRYGANQDCFVHVRLGDIADTEFNLGLAYYLKAIREVGMFTGRLYVASDSPDHEIVQAILDAYPGRSERVLLDEVATIQFGSTCRHVVLSHGSFSAVIGWLSFFSDVWYPAYEERMWHGDMFSVDARWRCVADYR